MSFTKKGGMNKGVVDQHSLTTEDAEKRMPQSEEDSRSVAEKGTSLILAR